ncbi:PTS sugar transporter subunit IIA [Myxococcota bacterium]
MIPEGWLNPSRVLPRLESTSAEELLQAVAATFASETGPHQARATAALLEAMRDEGSSLGSGVAVPHIELEPLSETLVCIATLREPLPSRTIDGRFPDVFVFVLSKPDPHAHLLLLAHIARLTQSRTFREGLRRAESPDEVIALVRAAEMRHLPARPTAVAVTSHALVVMSVSGEKALDALLIDLVDQGYGDACVLEAQSLREAAAREVPLFANFRDLFGDPGGRRMLLLEAPSERTSAILDAARRVCDEYGAGNARISVIPMQTHWVLPAAASEVAPVR